MQECKARGIRLIKAAQVLVLCWLILANGCGPASSTRTDEDKPRLGPRPNRGPLEPSGAVFGMASGAVIDGGDLSIKTWPGVLSDDEGARSETISKFVVDRSPSLRLVWPAEYPSATIDDLAWSPNGETLAVGGTVVNRDTDLFHSPTRLYDVNGGFVKELSSDYYTMSGQFESVSDLAWSPDGQTLAAAGGINYSMTLFDVHSENKKELTSFATSIFQVAWSPDGAWFVLSTGDRDLYLYDSDGELQSKVGPAGGGLSWHPNGRQLASVDGIGVLLLDLIESSNGQPARLKPSTRVRLPLGQKQWAREARWSPDGSRLAACGFGTGDVWLMEENGKPMATLVGHAESVFAIAWSAKNELASSSADLSIRIWDQDGTPIASLMDEPPDNSGIVDKIQWSPDGRFLAVPSPDEVVRIHTRTGEPVTTLAAHQGLVTAIAWHPDSKRIATADDDEVTLVWELKTD